MTLRLQDKFFVSRCTIWGLPTPRLQNNHGEIRRAWPADYTEVAGHRVIPCALGIKKGDGGKFVLSRDMDATFTSEPLYALLEGYYPLITAEMVAVVDTVAYTIKGTPQQGQRLITELALELIK
jgi:hypothetical protein